jgi:hypothetical protein
MVHLPQARDLKHYIKDKLSKDKSKATRQAGQRPTTTPNSGRAARTEHEGGTSGLPNPPNLTTASTDLSAPIAPQASKAPAQQPKSVLHQAPNVARQVLGNDILNANPQPLEVQISTLGEQAALGEQATGGEQLPPEVPAENLRDLWAAAFDNLEDQWRVKLLKVKDKKSTQNQADKANGELVESIVKDAKAMKEQDKKQSWRPVSH